MEEKQVFKNLTDVRSETGLFALYGHD
eukprot:COSAG02_NODE_7838_length_2824_cov_2.040734_4_plen_26_part_01